MVLLALLFSIFIAVIGAIGFVSPAKLIRFVRKFQSSAGLYLVAGFRVVFGLALFFAADSSRAPEVIRVVGIIVLVSGLITPLFGLDRFRRILNWWSMRPAAFQRVWAGFALAFGLVCAYAVAPCFPF
jgi:hypothetical protein